MASIEPRVNKDGQITSYRIEVCLGYEENGKKIKERTTYKPEATTPAKARKEVEQFAIDFEKRVKEGSAFLSGERITFKEFVKYWEKNSLNLKVKSGELTLRSKEDCVKTMERHAYQTIGHMKLSKIRATHIDRIVLNLLDNGRKPKTVRNVFNIIRSCFDYAFRKELIKENPCLRCEKLPEVKRGSEIHFWTGDQVQRFLKDALSLEYEVQIKGHTRQYTVYNGSGKPFEVQSYTEKRSLPFQMRVYFFLSIYGGFRRGELIGLDWRDVDFENNTIRIDEAVSMSDEGQYMKDPKTEAGKRTIVLPRVCFDLLKEWKTEEKQICLDLGSAWEGSRGRDFDRNPIFIQEGSGKRMNVQTPSKTFKKIVREYNKTVEESERLPEIRLHDLRHTCATHLVASGVDFETIAKRLGHSRASFTLDIYGHALPENDQKASDKLEEVFAIAK